MLGRDPIDLFFSVLPFHDEVQRTSATSPSESARSRSSTARAWPSSRRCSRGRATGSTSKRWSRPARSTSTRRSAGSARWSGTIDAGRAAGRAARRASLSGRAAAAAPGGRHRRGRVRPRTPRPRAGPRRRPRGCRRRPRRPREPRSKVTASSAAIAASGSMSWPNTIALVGGVAGDGAGVLERRAPGARRRRRAPAATSSSVGPSVAQLVDDLAHARVRLDALRRLQARAQLQDRHVGERVVERVHRVAQARASRGSPRTGASPSSRRAASSRSTAPRARARPRRRCRAVDHAQVRLVGVALLDERLRRERRAPAR